MDKILIYSYKNNKIVPHNQRFSIE